jgi:drug/metabolite transporter (DMT)-like permease
LVESFKGVRRSRLAIYTGFALIAFAMNSLLCRTALKGGAIDAAGFTTFRMVSAAAALWLIAATGKQGQKTKLRGSWLSAMMLFLYAACFSFAYIDLSTGTGALILFGAVQATMIFAGFLSGERLHLLQGFGFFLALAGLVYLAAPGIEAPPVMASLLMAAAGIAWGIYSLRGRAQGNPLADTGGNFVRVLPFVAVICLLSFKHIRLTGEGVLLAIASGALASGLGYIAWYAALKGLTAHRAATVQLTVPLLAALGGVIFLSEEISTRLIISTFMILGGVRLTLKH